jgi:hypothetical protein
MVNKMNERIQTLLAKFKETESTHRGAHVLIGIDEIEKFAELIVRECVSVLDKAQWDKGEDWVCADGTRIIPQIKQHFGVE